LIARQFRGAAAAHRLAGDGGEADLIGRIEKIAGADEGGTADERQFVVFEQINLHTVGQGGLFDVRDFDLGERRELQVLPRGWRDRARRRRFRGRRRGHWRGMVGGWFGSRLSSGNGHRREQQAGQKAVTFHWALLRRGGK